MTGLALFKNASRDVPTVSHQDVDDSMPSPKPSVDLYRLHKCHNYHDEIEDHETAPGHSQPLMEKHQYQNERQMTL
jgi:hypothetical protein